MLLDHFLIRSRVHTIDLVSSDITMEPLNLWSQAFEDATRFLRNSLQLIGSELSCTGNITLDHVFRHCSLHDSGLRRNEPQFARRKLIAANSRPSCCSFELVRR